jgi:hypothetical protein
MIRGRKQKSVACIRYVDTFPIRTPRLVSLRRGPCRRCTEYPPSRWRLPIPRSFPRRSPALVERPQGCPRGLRISVSDKNVTQSYQMIWRWCRPTCERSHSETQAKRRAPIVRSLLPEGTARRLTPMNQVPADRRILSEAIRSRPDWCVSRSSAGIGANLFMSVRRLAVAPTLHKLYMAELGGTPWILL